MSTSSIQFPSDLGANVLSGASALISNLSASGYITIILGVILGTLVIEILIHALRK